MRCITVLYPNSPGVRFDFDYYMSTHMALVDRLYGKSIARIDVRRGLATPDGKPPAYIAVVALWIASQEAFEAASRQHGATVAADVQNFSSVPPVLQVDESL